MPTKILTSQAGRTGSQKTFKFGGGANTVFAIDDGVSTFGYIINGGGGNDTIFGSDSVFGDLLIGGDGSDTIFGGEGDDIIYGGETDGSDTSKGRGSLPTNTLVGDGSFTGTTVDTIVVSDSITVDVAPTILNDDGVLVSALSYGDTIYGGNGGTNNIYGDYVNVTLTGAEIADDAPVYIGGSDTLTGGDNDDALLVDGNDLPQNNIYGDAEYLTLGENTEYTGGVDHITGGTNADNSLYGDVGFLTFLGSANSASFTGGDDVITGGDAFGTGLPVNDIYGDAVRVTFSNANGESFTGGDDTIFGGDLTVDSPASAQPTNVIYGDVSQIFGSGSFQGGNDEIHSGTFAADEMYGDWGTDGSGTAVGGADTFVFGMNNGDDTIFDFRSTDGDKINLFDTGLTEFGDLAGHITDDGTDTTIDLGQAIDDAAMAGIHTITVLGVTELDGGDFEFSDWMTA
ncbi:MAG: hypothetical protein ACU0B1_16465 [Thermohalobaculum sp.]